MKRHLHAHPATVILAFVLIIAVGAYASLLGILYKGAHPEPAPRAQDRSLEDGFPQVDWEYWLNVNPDVIGWVTIEGTGINHPIVQAPKNDKQFYLCHDIYGEWNLTGCPYLDAGCAGGLLESPNSIVYGHNMGWNQDMFGDLELFSDRAYAMKHATVLLQTPSRKARLAVIACDIIPGWEESKRCSFAGHEDFVTWWNERFQSSTLKLAEHACADLPVLTLCTCSYNEGDDERTLVYCQELPEWMHARIP